MNRNQYTNERAWSNYWTTGYQSTFTGHEDSGFFIHLADYWKEQFDLLKDGSRIVDLGCGNGSVSAIAAGCSGKDLDIIAVDYAAVERSSSVFKQNPNIEIRDHTKIEKTGIDDSSIDLCVSQFGYEYADRIGAAKEAHRILKSGGKLVAVVHHRQSQISQSCVSAHRQIGLCYRSRLTDISRKLIKRLRKLEKSNRDKSTDETAIKAAAEFNEVAAGVFDHGSRLPDMEHVKYFLNELTSLFSEKARRLNFSEKMAIIDAVEENARNYQLRMEAMLKASLDKEHIKLLEQSLRDTGLNVDEISIMKHDQKIFAWRVIATK
jgi:ubiquinone/menaquinone biosynthesis C-methylase UbiE